MALIECSYIYIYNEREREREKRKREKAVGREIEQRVRVQSDNFRFMSFVYDGRPPSIDSGGQERRRKKNVCLRVKRKKKKNIFRRFIPVNPFDYDKTKQKKIQNTTDQCFTILYYGS